MAKFPPQFEKSPKDKEFPGKGKEGSKKEVAFDKTQAKGNPFAGKAAPFGAKKAGRGR